MPKAERQQSWLSPIPIILLIGLVLGIGFENRLVDAKSGPTPQSEILEWSGIVEVFEDQKRSEDWFELWTLRCNRPVSSGKCVLLATSFATMSGQTHVHQWFHKTNTVRRLGPSGYRLNLDGRLSDCSGLELAVTMDAAAEKIRNLEGTMLAGTKCQGKNQFRPDLSNESRRIAPIFNEAYAWNLLERQE